MKTVAEAFVQVLGWLIAGAVLLLLLAAAVHRWRRYAVVRRFRARYGPAGKDLLIVLTESRHWQPYIERHWLPRWASRAVVLDRSKPWRRDDPAAELWASVKGFEEHTPLAVVVPPRGGVRVVRFYKAFRDYKHGKGARLRTAERALEAALEESGRHGG